MPLPDVRLQFAPGAGPFDVIGGHYLNLTGVTTSQATTPDHASFAVTDLSVGIDLKLDDWIPTTATELCGQFGASTNQRAWLLWISPDGKLNLRWSTNGTNETDVTSAIPIPVPLSGRCALYVFFDVNNGAGGKTATFATAPVLGGAGTTFSTVTTGGTTSIHNSTTSVGIGRIPGSGFTPVAGRCYGLEWETGILTGSDVAHPDFTAQTVGATSFTDAPGRTWTIVSPAAITGFDWVDLSNRIVQDPTWQVGRTDELDQFPPGGATFTLRNTDRFLDPEYTAGPWFGELNPRTPFRWQLDDGTDWTDQYYGFVQNGFEQTYYHQEFATVTIQLVDLLLVLQSELLPRTALDGLILGAHASAYWKLDEESGTQMLDSSGNGFHGFYDNGIEADPLVIGGGHSRAMVHVGDERGEFKGEGLPIAPPCTIEAWVKFPRNLSQTHNIVVVQRDQAFGSGVQLMVETSAAGSPNGQLVINFAGLGSFYKARGHTRIDDDEIHHVVVTIASTTAADILLYVDGVAQTKTTISGTNGGNWTSHLIWTLGNTTNTGQGDFGLGGLIDEVAVYPVVLTPERIADHYEAGATAFDNEPTGDRIDRVLNIIGCGPELCDLATGDTVAGPASYDGRSAADYISAVVETEQGFFFVDHHGGGLLKFRGRYSRFTETRSTISQATFTDDGTFYPYRPEVAPEPNSIESVINVVDVQWRGGTETIEDTTSRGQYGAQSHTITTEAPTPQVARSAGFWILSRYAQPKVRIRSLPINSHDERLLSPSTDLRVADRITVVRHPVGVGSAITNTLIVEGITHRMSADKSWFTTFYLSDADLGSVWVWGTSTWDETKYWG